MIQLFDEALHVQTSFSDVRNTENFSKGLLIADRLLSRQVYLADLE